MGTLLRALRLGLARGPASAARALDGFVDRLLQKFEDSRPGLTAAMVADPAAAERFFGDLYDREVPRLTAAIQAECPHLSSSRLRQLQGEIDAHVRRVLLPAYVRHGVRFTRTERNDFYLLPEGMHGLERALWVLAGMGVGAFVVWAPFIPLWSKQWVLPFVIAGLFFPEVRRLLAFRRYGGEINGLVGRCDREIERLVFAYLTHGEQPRGLAAIDAEVETGTGTGTEGTVAQPGPRHKVEEGR